MITTEARCLRSVRHVALPGGMVSAKKTRQTGRERAVCIISIYSTALGTARVSRSIYSTLEQCFEKMRKIHSARPKQPENQVTACLPCAKCDIRCARTVNDSGKRTGHAMASQGGTINRQGYIRQTALVSNHSRKLSNPW